MEPETADCVGCQANRGEIVAPGGALYDDGLWRLEHTFEPFPMVGWLILKPLRMSRAWRTSRRTKPPRLAHCCGGSRPR